MTVAALYVDPKGVYANLPDVEVWDEARDARLYAGPWPVVAHPPCGRWCRLAPFVQAVYGHKIGADNGCFAAALDAVRTYGGVLEHPAYSLAWREFDLQRPHHGAGWQRSLLDEGWVCYMEQGYYGLPVRKGTWLYAVGVDLADLPFAYSIDSEGWGGGQDEWGGMNGWRDKFRDKKSASSTPPEFRDVLLAMARSVSVPPMGATVAAGRKP